MKKIEPSTEIAPGFAVKDWQTLRPTLIKDFCKEDLPESWNKARQVFAERIERRYLSPLENIIERGQRSGEGFAVMSLLCLLLEHFATWRYGLIFAFIENDEQIYPYEYNRSIGIFKDFLAQESPFKDYFTRSKAYEFYKNVRCGLLHEARTKEDWIVRHNSNRHELLWYDAERRSTVVNRHAFYAGLKIWWQDIFLPSLEMDLDGENSGKQKEEIKKNTMTARANFIRKMDDICDEKPEIGRHFAYGSNISQKQMEDRLPGLYFRFLGIARLDGYEFAMNKVSKKDGTGKANICPKHDAFVLGAIYEMEKTALEALRYNYEIGYDLHELSAFVYIDNETAPFSASAFIATENLEERNPSEKYVNDIRTGMLERGFPEKYMVHVLPNR